MTLKIASIWRYPVKSMMGEDQAHVKSLGKWVTR